MGFLVCVEVVGVGLDGGGKGSRGGWGVCGTVRRGWEEVWVGWIGSLG